MIKRFKYDTCSSDFFLLFMLEYFRHEITMCIGISHYIFFHIFWSYSLIILLEKLFQLSYMGILKDNHKEILEKL